MPSDRHSKYPSLRARSFSTCTPSDEPTYQDELCLPIVDCLPSLLFSSCTLPLSRCGRFSFSSAASSCKALLQCTKDNRPKPKHSSTFKTWRPPSTQSTKCWPTTLPRLAMTQTSVPSWRAMATMSSTRKRWCECRLICPYVVRKLHIDDR